MSNNNNYENYGEKLTYIAEVEGLRFVEVNPEEDSSIIKDYDGFIPVIERM